MSFALFVDRMQDQLRPSADDLAYTKNLLQLLFDMDSLKEGDSVLELLQTFMVIFNGNIRDRRLAVALRHHCHLGCPCKCNTLQDLKKLASRTYLAVVMKTRPPIPALSRWLRCFDTACWFLCPSCTCLWFSLDGTLQISLGGIGNTYAF